MKILSALPFFALLATQSFSAEAPKGNETGNRLSPSADSLVKMINAETVYKIDQKEERCPSIIQLKKQNPDYLGDRKMQDGDIPFVLRGYESEGDNLNYDYFVHENSSFVFRPALKGKSGNLSKGCEFVLGIACRSDYQETKKDTVSFEGSAKVFSIAMIVSTNTAVQFNSEKNTVSYIFKGTGVPDLICNYKAAPDLKTKIKTFEASLAEKKYAPTVNDSGRGNVKTINGSDSLMKENGALSK